MKDGFVVLRVLLLILVCSGAFAQDPLTMLKMGPDDLDTASTDGSRQVLSATRSLQDADGLPVAVYIVTREEILENGYVSLVDVLKNVPGIKVSQPGSAIEGETFLMRGLFGNYYTKILVDDIPLQPSVTGGMPIGDQLPVRQAERIEIILGPASTIYGADAMAGVINIITKDSERPVYAQADISIGNNGYDNLNVMIGGKIGKRKNVLQYSIFGSASSARDTKIKYDIAGNYNPFLYDSSFRYIQAPYYQGDTFSPLMNELPQQSRMLGFKTIFRGLSLSYLYMKRSQHSSVGQQTALYSYADPFNFWAETIQRITLSHSKSWMKARNRVSVSYVSYRLDRNSSFGMIYDLGFGGKAYKYASGDDLFFEDIFTVIPIKELEISGGLSFQYSGNLPRTNDLAKPFDEGLYKPFSEDVALNDSLFGNFGIYPVTFWNAGGFIQLHLNLEGFNVYLSGRLDHHSEYGSYISPKLALAYRITPEVNLWGGFGTGFRAPSTYFKYYSLAFPVDGGIYYQVIPNPDLMPETLYNGEIGVRWAISSRFRADAHAFYHVLNDKINRSIIALDPEKYPDAADQVLTEAYVNDGSSVAKLFGLQVNAMAEKLIESIDLDVDLFLGFFFGSERLPNDLGELDSYRMTPKFLGQFNISANPFGKVYLYLRNIYSTETFKRFLPLEPETLESIGYPTRVPGYYTMDLILRFSIYRNLQAFFQMNNVFDRHYGGMDAYGSNQDLLYNPQYGRNYRMGLSFTIE